MNKRLGIAVLVLSLSAICLAVPPGDNQAGSPAYGYDLIIGPRSSPWQLAMNTIYHLGNSPGLIPYSLYDDLAGKKYRPMVKIAVPIALGDTIAGKYCIEATLPKLFGIDDAGNPLSPEFYPEYAPGQHYKIAEGKCFAPNRFQAVIGSDLPALLGYKIGTVFRATHGKPTPGDAPDIHDEKWTIVGVLAPTHTPADRTAFIPLQSFYAVREHAVGMLAQKAIRDGQPPPRLGDDYSAYTINADGTFNLKVALDAWEVSAILVHTRGAIQAEDLIYAIGNRGVGAMAIRPERAAGEPADVFHPFLALGIIPADPNSAAGGTAAATTTDSPAARAGIKPGDVLIQFDDSPINTTLDLAAGFADLAPGQTTHLKLQRGGETLTIDVLSPGPAH